MNEENELFVEFIHDPSGDDISIRLEIALLLFKDKDLAETYFKLFTLSQIGYTKQKQQHELAERLHVANDTYYARRDELARLGLIKLEKEGKKVIIRFHKFNRLRNFKLPTDPRKHDAYLDEQMKAIRPITEEDVKKEKAYQEQLALDGMAEAKAVEIVKKEKEAKKKEEARFPTDDYRSVIEGYRKYKGVGIMPHSPDEMRIKHRVKEMFLSGHKVFDILECMRFFNKYCKREEYSWMYNWTIETIMKKMPEFKAGKLRLPELGDGLERF
jgi:predicted nucleic-acid-binding Zn-ribbon protein